MNRSRLLTLVLALALTCIAPQAASAAYGDLDADFGSAGRLNGLAIANPIAVEIQSDRKIVIAGGLPSNFTAGRIARLLPNGALDKTFGASGFVDTGNETIRDIALLADRRIAITGGNKIKIYRADGTLDSGFDSDGILDFGFTPTSLRVASIAAQGDSKLLVSGSFDASGLGMPSSLLRYNLDGTQDASFGNAGVAEVSNARSIGGGNSPIAITPDGDILLGVDSISSTTASNNRAGVAKFTASGQRILAFGEDGFATDPQWKSGFTGNGGTKIVVARDGGFVALTKSVFASTGKGAPWKTYFWAFFAANGKAKSGFPNRFAAEGAAAVAGPGFAVSFSNFVSRYKSDLTLDYDFALNGHNRVDIGPCSDWEQLASDVDGSLVAVGSCDIFGQSSQAARYLGPDGGRPAPQVRAFALSWSEKFRGKPIHRSWPRVVTGSAMPRKDLRRVAIAVKRVDRPLAKRGLCGWLTDNGKRYSRSKKCGKPVFMTAKGGNLWRFDFARPLPPGKYKLYARAYTKDGRFNPINDDADTYMNFTVKRPIRTK
jgi:uncharacterized delta-60 repeat protein